MLGEILSLSVSDSTFVISTGDDIVLYDFQGNQTTSFSRKGRGKYEYIAATSVRCYGEQIYVWCGYSLKFIIYDRFGNGIAECQYPSAVRDFRPCGDKIYIYTGGIRGEHVIDVLDFTTGDYSNVDIKPSTEHLIQVSQEASSPMDIYGDKLFFMTKDKLCIYSISSHDNTVTNELSFKSKSFHVSQWRYGTEWTENIKKALSYMFNNSYIVSLAVSNDSFKVLTSEGSATIKNTSILHNNLASTIYDISINDASITSYNTGARLPKLSLIYSFSGNIYGIAHEVINNTDEYSLYRLH